MCRIPSRPVHYRILMEPVGMNIFFLARVPQTLEGNYKNLGVDDGGAVFDLDPDHPVGRYEATSDVARPGASDLRAAGDAYPRYLDPAYLRLPASLDPRIPRLAQQISGAAGNNYDKALALETYLRTHFDYTLQLSRTVPHDPLANFLFERKQGHCEYFASSMAVMLRSLGIPARIVNGFRTGEFNDLTSQYVIRASNAHSWVEAFFPGYGWIDFDPTPGASMVTRTGWNRFALYEDAMASFWRDWVVNYDAGHQQALAVGVREAKAANLRFRFGIGGGSTTKLFSSAARRSESAMAGSPVRWGIFSGLTAIFLLLAVNARFLWQVSVSRRPLSRATGKVTLPGRHDLVRANDEYARRRHGWRKSPGPNALKNSFA